MSVHPNTDVMKQKIMEQAKQDIMKKSVEIKCPHCSSTVTVPSGKSLCPQCQKEIDLVLKLKF